MNDQTNPNSQAQLQMALAQYQQDVDTIITQGREAFGEGSFDEMGNAVGAALGGQQQQIMNFMDAARQCDRPVEVIKYLSEHPAEAEKISKMHDARRLAAMARIEAQLMPSASGLTTGADAAWRSQARRGNAVDVTSPDSDGVADDRWYAALKRSELGKKWGF